jgi:hypothetical protein
MLKLACCAALLFFFSTAAHGQSTGKIPSDVIDFTAAHGKALVLVGLDLPWQMESRLSQEDLLAQRTTIASIQNELLDKLAGRKFTVVRRYQEIPGIALEVGADALAELARLPIVTNVLLDRPALPIQPQIIDREVAPGTAIGILSSEKVPSSLFARATRDGTVLVLAGLKTPWQREDLLTDNLVDLQRNAIHGVQSYLLGELAGTHYKVMRLYGKIPGIALRVGVDALMILERSPAITNVVPDRAAQLSR